MNAIKLTNRNKLECVNKTIKNRSFRNIEFTSSTFKNLVISDVKLLSVRFSNCYFERVIIESSHIEDIQLIDSKIDSISVRGNREITKASIFKRSKQGILKSLQLNSSNNIVELSLKGNLQILDCEFPDSKDCLHIKNPYNIYCKCLDIIKKDWEGEDQQLGLTEIETFYIGKNVENQNEDFVTFESNSHLSNDQNRIIRRVFDLVETVSKSL